MASSTLRTDGPSRARRAIAAGIAAAAALLARDATASPESVALFEEGRRLMDAGRVAEACRTFEKSFALDPLGGTLMGLAICHEKEGKLATALREFERARAIAEASGRSDRVAHALRAIASLEPRVPRLIVEVPPPAVEARVEVRLDGVTLAPDEWNTAIPIDPGPHRVTWSAAGRADGAAEVTIAEGVREQVSVVFGDDPAAGAAAPAGATAEGGGMPPLRIAAWVTGGVGVASLGIGTALGIVSLGHLSDSDEQCEADGARCTPEGVASYESGSDLALAADLTIGLGLGLVATSVVLFLLPAEEEASAGAAAPWVRVEGGPGRAALATGGRF